MMRRSLQLVGIGWVLFAGASCSSEHERELPKLTVGIQNSPAMTLVMVAEDAGFFDRAGVDVEIKEFTAGKFALQAFLGGSLDVAISGEVPVTLASLQGNKFRVLAQVVEKTINECRIVARVDSNSSDPAAFFNAKRRKLATSFGGGPEFFTHRFFLEYGIDPAQVELISQKPEDMPATLVAGSVDAISIFDPFARIAEREMGDAGVTFANAEIYSELYVIDVLDTTIQQRTSDLEAFLKGLHDAQSYIEERPGESKAILMKYTSLDREIIDEIWENFVFKVAITPLFVEYTSAQALWAVDKGSFPASTPIPDFSEVLYPDLLRKVAPNAVDIGQ